LDEIGSDLGGKRRAERIKQDLYRIRGLQGPPTGVSKEVLKLTGTETPFIVSKLLESEILSRISSLRQTKK